MTPTKTDTGTALCFWCHSQAAGSPYRSPIDGIPGGRYIVCGPDCPRRPEGVRVVTTVMR